MADEEWRVISEFPKYEVSSQGNVRRLTTGKLLTIKKERYVRAALYSGEGKPIHTLVHRLVASAFIPNPDSLPVVDHIDRNPHNNSKDNLRWVTHRQNIWNKAYKGVSKRPSGRYEAKIRDNTGKRLYLGTYDTEEEACEAYRMKAAELRGDVIAWRNTSVS